MLTSATLNKLARSHMRLWLSIVAALVIFLFLPLGWSAVARVLVSWNCGVVMFLGLVWQWMLRLQPALMRSRFAEEDETAGVILLMVTLSALLSLIAIFALLVNVKQLEGAGRGAHIALAATTIISSWALVPTMFTMHYADRYYSSKPDARPLTFPQTKLPDFWDFVYFSFTIAVACQTADVCTNTTAIRKTVIGHAVVSFIFNASILGFAINISAGLVGAS
ncbi:MAG: hypothetical protein JWR16_2873 [Nevskia sp.]|nr:hypothetical protein [Nevskia sp.]